jgi:hypothetical protein
MLTLIAFFNKFSHLLKLVGEIWRDWQEKQKLAQARHDGINEQKLEEIARTQENNKRVNDAEKIINEVEPASFTDIRDKLRRNQF